MSANPKPLESWPALDAVLSRWSSRRILTPDQFAALSQAAKNRAGSLAGVWETKFVSAIYDSMGSAMRDNLSSADWMTEAQKILDAYGGGTKLGLYSGETFSPWYASTVFRANVTSALAAGRYADMFSPAGRQMAEFWMFSAIHDDRNEDEKGCPGTICRQLDGKVFAKDDPQAAACLPPLHFQCRCSCVELDSTDVADGGYDVASSGDFSDLLSTPDVWSDDKLSTLVAGPDAPMYGVDVTGLEPRPNDADVWGDETAGHDADPLSFLTAAGFDDSEASLLRGAIAHESADGFFALGQALEGSWGEMEGLSGWDQQQFLSLNTYLDALPPFPAGKTLYRAARMSAQEAGRLIEGKIFRPDSFFLATSLEASALQDLQVAGGGSVGVELRIIGQTSARTIEAWSSSPGEVLFKPGAEFRIVKVERMADDRRVVTLEET